MKLWNHYVPYLLFREHYTQTKFTFVLFFQVFIFNAICASFWCNLPSSKLFKGIPEHNQKIPVHFLCRDTLLLLFRQKSHIANSPYLAKEKRKKNHVTFHLLVSHLSPSISKLLNCSYLLVESHISIEFKQTWKVHTVFNRETLSMPLKEKVYPVSSQSRR